MTTTARELAAQIVIEAFAPITENQLTATEVILRSKYIYKTQMLIEQAILDAEARGRESVLSRVPSEDEIEKQQLIFAEMVWQRGHIGPPSEKDKAEYPTLGRVCRDYWIEYILAKLKERE